MARSSSAPRDSSDCPPANRCWKPDEDDLLRQAVQKYGPGKWALAAQSVPGRSNHQVRQRWMFYLDPTINKQPLTDAEYNIILREQSQIGNKWMDIARLLPGRYVDIAESHVGMMCIASSAPVHFTSHFLTRVVSLPTERIVSLAIRGTTLFDARLYDTWLKRGILESCKCQAWTMGGSSIKRASSKVR